ncbi:MAG: Gfo/Idh/MocA family protein [Paracoccaceae bacterium]
MIGVAIIGAGIGAQHLDGYQKIPGVWDVRAIVDLDLSRARSVAGDIPVFDDIAPVLQRADISVIDICLPPHLHVPTSLMALLAGKHVICEKPLATSMRDIDQLRQAQADTGMRIFPVFQYRFGPSFNALNALQSAEITGAPLIAAAETHWARGADYYGVPWRGTWAGEQGGAVLGHAIHAHDLLCTYLGPIRAVSGAIATRANAIETEDCAALNFEFENGALATSSITLGAARDETRLRFVYENMTATSATNPYAPGQDVWTFTARKPADQSAIDRCISNLQATPSGFAGAFAEIAKALQGEPNRAVDFDAGAASIALVTAIYDAARNGTRVTVPVPKSHPLYVGWRP